MIKVYLLYWIYRLPHQSAYFGFTYPDYFKHWINIKVVSMCFLQKFFRLKNDRLSDHLFHILLCVFAAFFWIIGVLPKRYDEHDEQVKFGTWRPTSQWNRLVVFEGLLLFWNQLTYQGICNAHALHTSVIILNNISLPLKLSK